MFNQVTFRAILTSKNLPHLIVATETESEKGFEPKYGKYLCINKKKCYGNTDCNGKKKQIFLNTAEENRDPSKLTFMWFDVTHHIKEVPTSK